MQQTKEDEGKGVERRTILALPAVALALAASQTPATAATAGGGPLSPIPIELPKTEFVYEAICTLEKAVDLGSAPLGDRRIINITGGEFAGPRLRGKVLPGGADRQLLRKDGIRQLDALYELQTDDGTILTIHNQAIIDAPKDGPRYAFSHLEITAPEGPYAWLNRRAFVGTVTGLAPEPKVLIRVFSLI